MQLIVFYFFSEKREPPGLASFIWSFMSLLVFGFWLYLSLFHLLWRPATQIGRGDGWMWLAQHCCRLMSKPLFWASTENYFCQSLREYLAAEHSKAINDEICVLYASVIVIFLIAINLIVKACSQPSTKVFNSMYTISQYIYLRCLGKPVSPPPPSIRAVNT